MTINTKLYYTPVSLKHQGAFAYNFVKFHVDMAELLFEMALIINSNQIERA
jgi:hypothetical protein